MNEFNFQAPKLLHRGGLYNECLLLMIIVGQFQEFDLRDSRESAYGPTDIQWTSKSMIVVAAICERRRSTWLTKGFTSGLNTA